MSDAATLRFLHAAELQLDRPLQGLPEMEAGLRSTVKDARYRALDRLVATAIERHVDCVILAGGILSPDASGSRAPWVLNDAFKRLRARGIHVFWAEADAQSQTWMNNVVGCPDNVTCIRTAGTDRTAEIDWTIRTQHVLVGANRLADLPANTLRNLLLRIIPSRTSSGLERHATDGQLWLEGGDDRFFVTGLHCRCGAIQADSAAAIGTHGVICGEWNLATRQLRAEFVPCDSVRWAEEVILCEATDTVEDVRRRVSTRRMALGDSDCEVVLTSWRIICGGQLWHALHETAGGVPRAVGVPVRPSYLTEGEWERGAGSLMRAATAHSTFGRRRLDHASAVVHTCQVTCESTEVRSHLPTDQPLAQILDELDLAVSAAAEVDLGRELSDVGLLSNALRRIDTQVVSELRPRIQALAKMRIYT